MKTTLAVLVVIVVSACGVGYYAAHTIVAPSPHPCAAQRKPISNLRTVKIKRGNLISTLNATGMVKPEELVEVGAQVTGMIAAFGPDSVDQSKPIDHGSIVCEDDILAQIDPTIYKAQVEYAEASLQRAKADLLQLQAKREHAQRDWLRAKSLLPAKAISDSDYDMEVADRMVTEANVAVGEAAIRQCEATLRIANTNLNYTIIKSPIDGVIIDRRINIGQTVVAALNAPPLFLIAKDLRRMQVWTPVHESEICRIQPGLPVRFTVNAYPGEVFAGEVTQVRLNAAATPNAVDYTVVASTNNFRSMLPYLTANVQFEIERRPNVLMVPNAALQWRPQPSPTAAGAAANDLSGQEDCHEIRTTAMPFLRNLLADKPNDEEEPCKRLWIKEGDSVRPVFVRIGASNGKLTEVTGNTVKEGMEVVVGEARCGKLAVSGHANNPFAYRSR